MGTGAQEHRIELQVQDPTAVEITDLDEILTNEGVCETMLGHKLLLPLVQTSLTEISETTRAFSQKRRRVRTDRILPWTLPLPQR